MSILIDDIKNFLVAQSIGSESTIFLDTLPDAPDNALSIYEYGGTPGGDTDGRRIQITVRNTTPLTAKTTINSIRNLLDNESPEQNVTLGTNRTCVFSAIQTPFKLKEDDKKRHYYICNFRVIADRD